MNGKRAIINLTDDQHAALKREADKLGLSVPAYIKVRALEAVAK